MYVVNKILINVQDKTIVNTQILSDNIIQGEKNATIVTFRLPSHYNEIDLSKCDYAIKAINNNGHEVIKSLDKTIVNDLIDLTWVVDNNFTVVNGKMFISIEASKLVNGVASLIWSTKKAMFRISDGIIDGDYPAIVNDILDTINELISKAKLSEEQAKLSAEQARLSENIAKEAKDIAVEKADLATIKASVALDNANKAKISETNSKVSEVNSKQSEINAKISENVSIDKANEASDSADKAKTSETIALQQSEIATEQANIATDKANKASTSEGNSLDYSNKSKRYAVGGVENGDTTDNAKYYKEQTQALKLETEGLKDETITYKNNAEVSSNISTEKANIANEKANIATIKASEALVSEQNAKLSEQKSKTSETNSKSSEVAAKVSEDVSKEKADLATNKAIEASNSANTASQKLVETINQATSAKSYAVGGTSTRPDEETDNAKYYYQQAKTIVGGNYILANEKGAANGVATLGEDNKIPSSQLPSYVDDVLEFSLYTSLPLIGEQGKIYVVFGDTKDKNGQYRWSGTTYISISTQIDFATQSEAESGTENTKAMTALRTKQTIDKFSVSNTDPRLTNDRRANGGNADTVDNYHFWTGSQVEYDAIAVKDNNTIYNIIDDTSFFGQADWNETNLQSESYIKNKPTSLPANGGNSDTVNGHTVQSDVPADAKFTDTAYVHPNDSSTRHVSDSEKSEWNGKCKIVKTALAPTDTSFFWLDTSNNGVLKYYNGTGWTPIQSVWG